MKKIVYSLFAAIFMLTGCREEDSLKYVNNVLSSINASIEQNPFYSRVQVNDNNGGATLSWMEGDAFETFGDVNAKYTYEVATSAFKVEGTVPQTIDYAVHPSIYNPSVEGTSLTMTLPASINNVEKQSNVPMWAGVPVDGHLSFKHLAAMLKIDLTGIADYTSIEVTADKALAGSFVANLADETPVLSSDSEANETVTITLNDVTDDAEVIYLPIPATTYGSLKVTAKSATEEKELKSWENLEFKRAMMYTASIVNLSTPQGVSEVLENLSTTPVVLNLPSDFTTDTDEEVKAITVPDVEGSDLTLNFDAVPVTTSETPLVIESEDAENTEVGASTKNLTLSIPSDENNQIDVQINTPTTTATVASGNYDTLEATTATNTLIINGGVKIQTLVILGGNVYIEAGVEIGRIVNSGNGIINYIVRSEAGLKHAFAEGGKYKVYNDIAITNTNGMLVSSGKSVVLDLNDKTITAEGDAFVAETGGVLTLNGNGFVKAGNTVGNWVAVWANGGTVTINDGNYSVGLDSDDSNSCVYVKNGGQVTINGGTFSHEIPTSGNNYGMPLQVNNDDTQGKIIVNAGVFMLDNGHFYEDQDETAGKIIFNADQKKDKDRIIVTGAFGNTVVITNTELSDALYKLYGDIYYIKINGNGYAQMRESEVLAIRELNFDPYEYEPYNGRITTLEGIEHFVNLEHLECRISSLKECDFSQNVNLISVAIQNTTELTSLDFSHNPKLQALYMNYNRGLTSLNLTGCTNLVNIQLFDSGLTSLDIPNKEGVYNLLFGGSLRLNPADYPNLSGLGCENMELTDLDSFIPDYMKSQLTFISCSNNQLTTLDLSKYPNLEDLSCGYNQIEELDPSKVPNLKTLGCSGNKIQTLDISNNVGLNQLWCGMQQLDENMILRLTPNQKAILVDNNLYFEPSEEKVTLEIVNKSTTSIENLNDGGNW